MGEALLPWLLDPLRRAVDALAAGRLAHGLLVCGPEHVGKRAFAVALRQALLCRARRDGLACGTCRDCALLAAGTHPDQRRIGLETNEKTGVARKEIVVEQVRDLGAWLALTPQRGGAQVAVIDPASALNVHAANALLKTLEEPLPGRYLLLLAEAPMQLPATVRSRVQRIVLGVPDAATAQAWLTTRGYEPAAARAALAAARGNPGLAAHWLGTGLFALRQGVQGDLAALAEGRRSPLEVAAAWLGDEHTSARLAFAAEHAVELAAAAPRRPGGDGERLAAWFDAANRTRDLLRTPIRLDLALAGLLRDWRRATAA